MLNVEQKKQLESIKLTKSDKTLKQIYHNFIKNYDPQYRKFNNKEVLFCLCPSCCKPNQFIIWPYIISGQLQLKQSWGYCISCGHYGHCDKLRLAKKREPISAMEAFINQSKQNFTHIFFAKGPEGRLVYYPALPLGSNALMNKAGLDPNSGQINSHIFNGSVGYCKGSDIMALGSTVRRTSRPKPYEFNEDTRCLIFPIAKLPGQYIGFIAYCENIKLEYRTRQYYMRKNRAGEYIYLSISNHPDTYISQSLDECIQDITDYSLLDITIMVDLYPVGVKSLHV